ncbi:serine hydrolase domain-containing protein [Paenibacillus endoradicis]|uniref:serine hydrolase domain-containing protein n=1 Tax=Paenibacillus endoradicis TaxID=2972487 RepID=UPI0021591088|nr:serine hydrolase domain-containing protein [Paenibacillus endoradicis]MCR8657355.1 beta-lactamase family protein [Paenibacillus endoradicis]
MNRLHNIDDLLKGFVDNNIVGCGCVVTKNGETMYEGYYGYADREQKILMNDRSIHRLYSTTKVIVCTAAMLLFERGKFLLNDPLHLYLPEFKEMQVVHTSPNGNVHVKPAQNSILVKHIFAMTSGIPYEWGESKTHQEITRITGELSKQGPHTLGQLITEIAKVPLLFEPGTRWAYGYSHDIVARLVEVISGLTIEQFIQKELLDPLQMKDTGYRFKEDVKSRLVPLYAMDDNNELAPTLAQKDENFDSSAIYNGGGLGIYSTPRDYTKFAQMLANGGMSDNYQIIGKKTIDLIRSNHLNAAQLEDFNNPYTAGYGYGLGVRTLIDPVAAHYGGSLGEFGWTGMSGTYALIDPAEQLSIVYMHQRIPNMELEHHLRLRNVVYSCL